MGVTGFDRRMVCGNLGLHLYKAAVFQRYVFMTFLGVGLDGSMFPNAGKMLHSVPISVYEIIAPYSDDLSSPFLHGGHTEVAFQLVLILLY